MDDSGALRSLRSLDKRAGGDQTAFVEFVEEQLETMSGSMPYAGFAVIRQDGWTDPQLGLLIDTLPVLAGDENTHASLRKLIDALIRRRARAHSAGTLVLRSGSRFVVDPSDKFAASLLAGMLVEHGDINVFCDLVRPGDTVLDIGANFGLYSIEVGRLVGPQGHVYAFEPGRQTASLLTRNVALNGLQDVVMVSPVAVGETSGRRSFFEAQSSSFSGFVDNGRGGNTQRVEVETIVLDEWTPLEGRSVDLVKLDVEGAELEVLKGAEGVLERSPEAILLVEANRKNLTEVQQARFVQWLEEAFGGALLVYAGFHMPDAGTFLSDREAITSAMSGNLLLVRKGSGALQRLEWAIARERARRAAASPDEEQLQKARSLLVVLLREEIRQRELDEDSMSREMRSIEATLAAERARSEALEAHLADLQRVESSRWWKLGRSVVFPVLNALRGRRGP